MRNHENASSEDPSHVNPSTLCTPDQTNSNTQQNNPPPSSIRSSNQTSTPFRYARIQINVTDKAPFVPSAIRQLVFANRTKNLIGVKDTNDKLFALFFENAAQVNRMVQLHTKSENKNRFSRIAISNNGDYLLFYTPGNIEASLFYVKPNEVAERERSSVCNFGYPNSHDASLTYIEFSTFDNNRLFVGYSNGDITLFYKNMPAEKTLNDCNSPVCHIECLSDGAIMYVAVSHTNGSVYLHKYVCSWKNSNSTLKHCEKRILLPSMNEAASCQSFCKCEPSSCTFAIFRDKTAYLYYLNNNELKEVYEFPQQIAYATWYSDGKYLGMTDGAQHLLAMHHNGNIKNNFNISKFTESNGNITALTAFPPQDKANADKIIVGTVQGKICIAETL